MTKPILLLCALLATLGAPVKAHAMAGELKEPSLAWPAARADTLRARVLTILSDKDCNFQGGHFINASTTLEYGGGTASLNQVLSRLAECEGLRLKVEFVREAGAVSWTVLHNAWGDPSYLVVQVNLAAPGMELTQLDIPVVGKAVGVTPVPKPVSSRP